MHRRLARRQGRRARRSGSASSACTWRRTPASRCTSAARPAGSTAPTTRWSTTTGPASRWSRSSPSRCPAPARSRRKWPAPTSPSCATCCGRWASPTSGWRRARCAATSTPRWRRAGAAEWGTRTETKNVNSLRSVERAVRYEIERQAAVLDAGGRIVQETRHFHEETGTTTPGRSKEEAQDYRYFPEPDLVPVAPVGRLGRADAGRAARAAGGAPRPAAGRVGPVRPGHDRDAATPARSTWSATPSPPAHRPADARKWWLGELCPARERVRHRAGRAADHAGAGGPGRSSWWRGRAQ